MNFSKPDIRNLIGKLPCVVYRFDIRTGAPVFIGEGVREICGYSAEEILRGAPGWLDLIVPRDKPRVCKDFAVSGKRSQSSMEYRLRHKSGRHVWVLDQSTIVYDEGRAVWRDGMLMSIRTTARTKAEVANLDLQFKLEEFKGAIDAATIVSIADLKGTIKYANAKFMEISGYSLNELVGKKHSIINSGYHAPAFWQEMWETISNGNIWRGEVRNRRKDGTFYWVDTFIIPLRNRKNTIFEYLSIRSDITDKKENEIRLHRTLRKAKESDQLKSTFLANISHEIRTPMNAIMGFAELLGMARRDLSEKKRVEFTRLILERSQDLLNVVNNILDISKIEAGQISCLPVAGNVNEMFDRLSQRFRAETIHLKKSRVVVSAVNGLKGEENNIVIDFQRLTQVLYNLLTNASKFTKEGSIEFGCRLSEPGVLEFWVKDTGIGIPGDKLETVFLPFRQADDTIHTRFGGSGLGLAISKGFVELLGGRIYAESTPGKGSTFYFTIPYVPVKPVHRGPHSSSLSTDFPSSALL